MRFSHSLAAAAALALVASLGHAQSAGPIKIVGSIDLSGGAADVGKDALAGIQFAVETLNKKGGVLGRKVTFEYQDNGTNPQRAVNQANQLVEAGADFLMSPMASSGALAVTKLVSAKHKIPMCVASSGADDLTMGKEFQPYIFSVTPNSWSDMSAMAHRLAKLPYKRYAIIAADYAGGRSNAERFKQFIKQLNPNVEIVVEEYPKLGASDYTASINKILAAKPDYVLSIHYGSDLITFTKQAKAVGFFQQVHNHFAALYDENTLKAMGGGAAVGAEGWQRAPLEPMLKAGGAPKAYATAFKAAKGEYPSDWSTLAYDCVMTWAQAVQAAKTTKADAVMKAIEDGEFQSMRGPLRFGKLDHQADSPVFVGRIEPNKELGRPAMELLERVPGAVLRPSDHDILQARGAAK
jgi:branched-chain amino acid transport system substrate-binding protein